MVGIGQNGTHLKDSSDKESSVADWTFSNLEKKKTRKIRKIRLYIGNAGGEQSNGSTSPLPVDRL